MVLVPGPVNSPISFRVFEVGNRHHDGCRRAVYPIGGWMNDHGFTLDKQGFLPAVISYYQTPEGKLLSRFFQPPHR